MIERAGGILLHITSLPSAYGIGDFGPGALRFVDFLANARQSIWQVLPLNPIDSAHCNSPYSSSSAFAGNPLLISPDKLIDDGFLALRDTEPVPEFKDGAVEFDKVRAYKDKLLELAWDAFRMRADHEDFDAFCRDQADWLDDYALFVTIKQQQGGADWSKWPLELRDRHPHALEEAKQLNADSIEKIKFVQYLFNRQWQAVKAYANSKGVQIFGDLPIYVNYDSSDTWSHPELFKLNHHKRPSAVAGVPPDYFSKTGQLWGNPVYDWEKLKETGFAWWIRRLEHIFRQFDLIRIDHFRGLVAFWEVPAGQKTAIKGEWVPVPVEDFLDTLKNHFGELPVIAEDLGVITDDVKEVMARYGFPGMKILLFAFGEDNPQHPYLPENYDENSVVYTGTHDNNTAAGWFVKDAKPADKKRLFKYLGDEIETEQVPEALIRLALRSKAKLAIIPMQDLLALPATARMNKPATKNGNWSWRLLPDQINDRVARHLAELTAAASRIPKESPVGETERA